MHRLFSAFLTASLLALGAQGCSLANINPEDCQSDAECAQAFGLGSVCQAGFCSSPGSCSTARDCKSQFGGGACVNGFCSASLPADPACSVTEPEDLFARIAQEELPPTVLGGVFSLEDPYDATLIAAARLSVRELNNNGGGIVGRTFGMVFCDNGGPMNSASGDDRIKLDEHAVDYLAGTLGVPAIIGPGSSSDAIAMVNRLLSKSYPTVVISPSATSPALTSQTDRLDPNDAYGLFWRTCPSDELQGAVLAQNVIGPDVNILKVAVVYDNDPYGIGLSQAFTTRYGGSADLFPYDVGGDVSGIGDQVASTNPDAVLVISLISSDSIAILNSLAGAGLSGKKIFFSDGAKDKTALLDPALSPDVQAMIKSAQGTVPARPSGTNYDLFKATYFKEFAIEADQYSFVAQTYDAGYVAAYGIVYAEAKDKAYDGRLVAEGLSHLSNGNLIRVGPVDWTAAKGAMTGGPFEIDIEGASGALNFNSATGEATAPIEVWAVSADFSDFTSVGSFTPTL